MGTVAVAQGRLDQARDLLDEALDQDLSANITSSVALGLIAVARLALADGDPGRAALLVAAAEGMRQRAGLRGWPVLRRGEAELVTQIREALGASSFDEKYAAGARLTRREVVAIVRDQPGASSPALGTSRSPPRRTSRPAGLGPRRAGPGFRQPAGGFPAAGSSAGLGRCSNR